MCQVNLKENLDVDYIYCLRYLDSDAVQTNSQPLEVTETSISCNLEQRQRSSQQILDLADYLWIHYKYSSPIRRWNSGKSFSSEIPLWVQLSNPKSFFDYFKDKFKSDDVMLIWDHRNESSNLNDIEEFCKQQKWRCTERLNVRGSEASVTILYDLDLFLYEYLTRAKTQLVIVTIAGKQRYFLSISKLFCFLKWSFLLSSEYSKLLQDIEEGKHDNEKCERYCRNYKYRFGQELPDCQFKGNQSKIQSLIRKVKIDADGSVTEVQFDNETSTTDQDFKIVATENQEMNEPDVEQDAPNAKNMDAKNEGKTSLRTRMKNLFRRK